MDIGAADAEGRGNGGGTGAAVGRLRPSFSRIELKRLMARSFQFQRKADKVPTDYSRWPIEGVSAVGRRPDDWAHDGRYDRVLEAYSRIDGYLRELWTWLQAEPAYRDRTHILVTTDHGRGHRPSDWRNHGATVPGSDEVWMAFVSPRMTKRGLWRDHEPLSTSQAAATLAAWMDVDWNAMHPNAGRPVP
jgi:hypothetical protein